MFGDSDLGVFFDPGAFGVPVVFGGFTAYGILDTFTDVYTHGNGPGGFERKTVQLSIPYNAFALTPRPMDPIIVNGLNYTVREIPEDRDPATIKLYLKLA